MGKAGLCHGLRRLSQRPKNHQLSKVAAKLDKNGPKSTNRHKKSLNFKTKAYSKNKKLKRKFYTADFDTRFMYFFKQRHILTPALAE